MRNAFDTDPYQPSHYFGRAACWYAVIEAATIMADPQRTKWANRIYSGLDTALAAQPCSFYRWRGSCCFRLSFAGAHPQSARRPRAYRCHCRCSNADCVLLCLFTGNFLCLLSFYRQAGALTASVITLLIAGNGQNNPLHLALGGISISLFLNALTTYLILASGAQVPSLLFWLTGGLQGRSWSQLTTMLPWVIIAIYGTFYCRRVLELLSLDPQIAASMGLDIRFWKPFLLILAILPVAGIVPVAGPVAFVGLAAPHIARLLSRNDQIQTLILCIFLGGSMVSLADIVARTIAVPQELPVSIVTALIGGPVFIYLAQKRSISSSGNCR